MIDWRRLTPEERRRVRTREAAEDAADRAAALVDTAPRPAADPAYQRYLREFPRRDPRD